MDKTMPKGLGLLGLACGVLALIAAGCGGGGGGSMFGKNKASGRKRLARAEPKAEAPAATAKDDAPGGDQTEPVMGGGEPAPPTEADLNEDIAGIDDAIAGDDTTPEPPKPPPLPRVRPRPDTPVVGSDPKAQEALNKLARERAVAFQANFQEAQMHYQLGRRLYEAVRYEEAAIEFEKALTHYADHVLAASYLRKTRSLLGVHVDKIREALQQLSREKRVKIQEMLVGMQNALEQARQYHRLASRAGQQDPAEEKVKKDVVFTRKIDNLTRAIDRYDRVLEIIKWMPFHIDLSSPRQKARGLRQEAMAERTRTRRRLQFYQIERARQSSEQAREQVQRFRREKIAKLTSQAKALFQKEYFKECETLCQKILAIEPHNQEVQLLFVRSRGKKHEFEERTTYKLTKFETSASMLNVVHASTPYDRNIVYPSYWDKIVRRIEKGGIGGDVTEAEWKKAIRRKLQRKVSFEFVDTPLQEAITFLQQLTKVNMILDPQTDAAETPINLRIQNMTLELALSWILKLADLDFALKDDAIFISNRENLIGDVVLKIYDVADLTEKVPDFPGPDFQLSVGADPGSGGGAGNLGMIFGVDDDTPDASSLAEMIQTRVQPDSWAPELGTSIELHGQKLVVMQRPQVHRLIDKLLTNFRSAQKLMVTVEARFLTIRKGFFEDIGFDWGGLGGGGIPGVTSGNILRPSIVSETLNSPGGFPAGFINHPQTVDYFGRGVLHTIGAVTNRFDATGLPSINFSPENNPIVGTPPDLARIDEGLNATITHMGRIEAQLFLHAIRIRETGSILSAPRLTVYNTQRAHMFAAEQTSYIADYEISGDAYDPVIRQFLRGVIFDVRPIVSADRRYITLELRPTTIDLIRITTIIINTIQVLGTNPPVIVAIALPVQFPALSLTKVRTTVTIPDGGIILIGGLMRDVKFEAETGVPFLSNIPVIGKLFRWNRTDNERSNLIIMVTARLVLFDEEERKL